MDNSFSSVTFHFPRNHLYEQEKMRFVVSVDYNQIYFQGNGDVFGYLVLFCVSKDE